MYARFVDHISNYAVGIDSFLTVPSKQWLNYSEIFQISIPKITEGHKQAANNKGERPVYEYPFPTTSNHSTVLFLSPAADTFRIPPANSRRAESTTPPAPMVHPSCHISDDTSRGRIGKGSL